MPIGIDDLYFVIFLLIAGVAAGYVGGLFGIGGGTLLVPIFLTIFPYVHTSHTVVMHVAVGTSLALLVPNTAMAAYKQYKAGNIDFTLLKRWMPFIIIGATIGVSIIKFIPTLYLKIIFACYLYASFAFVAFKKERETDVEGAPHGLAMGVVGTLIGGFSVLLGSGGGTFSVPFMKLYHYPMNGYFYRCHWNDWCYYCWLGCGRQDTVFARLCQYAGVCYYTSHYIVGLAPRG